MTNYLILSLVLLTNRPAANWATYGDDMRIRWQVSSNYCQTAVLTFAGPAGVCHVEWDLDPLPAMSLTNDSGYVWGTWGQGFQRITGNFTNEAAFTNTLTLPIPQLTGTSVCVPQGVFRITTQQ